ncbi:hypothetical protein OIU84_015013 [Salix udensis]|uniref:Uncharacterized protein n=1 Tax=Salix udensis TaxID=889485 RepID=A0AAD6NS07_9ROSI|nr:hypothetical protein OIU84_015013 [Salix udensis]
MENPNMPAINSRGENLGLSSSATFLLPNSDNSKDPYVEMIQIQPLTYTSLRDLLPSSPPPPCLLSPNTKPMSTPDVDNRGLFQRLKDQCGCIRWFNDIVLKPLMVKFFGRGEEISDDDDEDDYLRRE